MKKYQLSKKKIIDTYIRYKLFSLGINGFRMSWKLVRIYVTMHYILAFYMKPFPESTKCQYWKVLVNELKIGTQICIFTLQLTKF